MAELLLRLAVSRYRRRWTRARLVVLAAAIALTLVGTAPAEEAPSPDVEPPPAPTGASRWDDTGRFYLLTESGFAFLADDHFAGDEHLSSHEFTSSNHV